jgi:hypothetical protein
VLLRRKNKHTNKLDNRFFKKECTIYFVNPSHKMHKDVWNDIDVFCSCSSRWLAKRHCWLVNQSFEYVKLLFCVTVQICSLFRGEDRYDSSVGRAVVRYSEGPWLEFRSGCTFFSPCDSCNVKTSFYIVNGSRYNVNMQNLGAKLSTY